MDIRRIQARVFEENALLTNKKEFTLNFELDGSGKLVLESFLISGFQKMVTMDSVAFEIKGEILL